jgi:hypothetical protein
MCLDASNNKSYPTDLPVKNGLVMWMDAADDTTFSYSSGTTVSQWRDKSGSNNHMAPISAAPTRNAFLNSRKVLAFTTTQQIRNTTLSLISSANTVFVICRYTHASLGRERILTSDESANNWLLGNYGNGINRYYANGWVNLSYDTPDTAWRIYMGDWSGPSTDLANFYSNGTAGNTNNSGASQGPSSLGINRYYAETSNCEVSEIVVFNRVLSTAERRLVHTYLGQKWGISNTDRSIVDLSNNNNHGLLGGLPGSQVVADMPLFDVYNKGALKLDGSTDYISVENATSLNPTTVTVSIWIKRHGYQSSVANYLRRNYNDAYSIIGDIAADNVRFRIHNGSAYPESPNATLSLNEWTNIVGTYDLANIKIYKNGVFVGQTAHTSAISYASANTTLTIGRDDPVAGRYMNANYGSVLIYSRALSAAEVLQNYEAQKSKFANTIVQQGLTGNFDAGNPYSYAGAGTTWFDVSGNNYTGSLTNGPTYSNQTILFDGTNDFIDLTTANVAVSSNGARSIYLWMRTTYTSNMAFIGTGTAANSQTFNVVKYSGNYVGVMGYNNDYYPGSGNSGITITDGIWHYIGVSFDGTNLRTYVDGILDNTSGTITYSTTGQNNFIGKANHTGNENYFNGNMGLVQFYNRSLSGAEVLQNYNATKGRFGR